MEAKVRSRTGILLFIESGGRADCGLILTLLVGRRKIFGYFLGSWARFDKFAKATVGYWALLGITSGRQLAVTRQ